MDVVLRGREALPEWDAFVASAGASAGFAQTRAWAQIDAFVNGAEPHVVEVRDRAGAITGGGLVTEKPGVRGGHALRRSHRALWCGDGPVLPNGNLDVLAKFLAGVDKLRRTCRTHVVRIGPLPPASGRAADPRISSVFVSSGYSAIPWCTALVRLDGDSERLFAGLSRSARKAVRRAEQAGVAIRACQTREEFLDRFVEPYRLWTKRAEDIVGASLAMWDTDHGRHYRFFVAELEDQPLATLGTYTAQGVATEIMSARNPGGPKGVPAQDALHWSALVLHQGLGDRLFDLAGFSPAPTTPKEEGIRRFKEKWGGRVVATLRFDYVEEPLATRCARLLQHRRSWQSGSDPGT